MQKLSNSLTSISFRPPVLFVKVRPLMETLICRKNPVVEGTLPFSRLGFFSLTKVSGAIATLGLSYGDVRLISDDRL
ncbi:unnamed protein product [Victoria cruziana]